MIGDKNYWRKGICTDVVKMVVNYAFKNLHLKRIELYVSAENKAAVRCYEKVGFKIYDIETEKYKFERLLMCIENDR